MNDPGQKSLSDFPMNPLRSSEHNQLLARFRLHFPKFVQPATDNFYHVVHFLQTVKLLSQNTANSISDSLESQHFPEYLVSGFALARRDPCFGVVTGTRVVPW